LLPAATHTNSMGYGIAKARLTIQQARSVSNARDIFASRLEQGNGDFSDRYGLALCQASLGLIDEADRTLTALVDQYPSIIAFWIGRAETLMLAGLVDAAMDVYIEANDLFPRNVPLAISFAESLINAGQPARAHALLLDLLNNVPPTPEQIRLIARAANAEGDVGNAYYYMGEYYLSVGNPALAMTQLRMALETPGINNVDRSRYDARLSQIVNAMPADQRRRMEQAGDGPRPQ
jgi:predicted Zn-dependent protease